MRLWLLLMAGGVTAFSQPFGFGVRGGVPLNDFVSTVQRPNLFLFFDSTTNRYVIGPMAELRLPFGLGVEVDALYRHFNFRGTAITAPSPTGTLFTSANTGAWEFPLLAKFRFPSKVIRPYVSGGVAWDTLTGLEQSLTSVVPPPPSRPLLVRHPTTRGFGLGAGFAVHVLITHLQPEVRYTRWGAQHFLDPNGGFSSNQNQAEFLLGITF